MKHTFHHLPSYSYNQHAHPRLVKIFRVAKWTLGRVMRRAHTRENMEDDLDDDLHFSMSVIG